MTNKIIIPTDFSDQSYQALKFIHQMNKEIGCELILLHVLDKYSHKIKKPATDKIVDFIKSNDLNGAFLELIYRLQESFDETIDIEGHFVDSSGNLPRDIVDESKTLGADWIAMGTHGANQLKDYIWGSNTTNVMELADIPVLAIPPEAKYDGDIDDILLKLRRRLFAQRK